MRLIHTAELHQGESLDYLVALQRHAAAVTLDPAAWMPWSYTGTLARLAAEATDPAPD
jgi:transposase